MARVSVRASARLTVGLNMSVQHVTFPAFLVMNSLNLKVTADVKNYMMFNRYKFCFVGLIVKLVTKLCL